MVIYQTCLLLTVVLFISAAAASKNTQAKQSLCLDPSSGTFVALAVDEDSYASVPGAKGHNAEDKDDSPLREPQLWTLVYEGTNTDEEIHGSFGGKFLQVLPDDGRSYPHKGEHMTDVSQLEGVAPYLSFSLQVRKEGWHTLFLRWTGGDGVGGGDSFYITMLHKKPKKGQDPIVRGQRTLKPATVPINTGIATYAGCCYNPKTHACPCFKTKPIESVCNSTFFIDRDRAAGFGAQCLLGPGIMTIVPSPQWYLFAGQDVGNVMDFDSQPWDATCEAEGSNTADSGHDFPSWNLPKGDFELRIYAREDGTAFDAFYIAGPDAGAPGILQRYGRGDSTFCSKNGYQSSSSSWMGWLVGISVVGIVVFVGKTDRGRELAASVSDRLVRSTSAANQQARASVMQYDRMDQLYEHPTAEMQNQPVA